jgi:transposase
VATALHGGRAGDLERRCRRRGWPPGRAPRRASGRADPRKRRWLLLRPPEQLDAEERAALALLLARDAELAKAHNLAQRFRALLQARDLGGFRAWLAEAQASELPSFVGTANGMLADRAAVEAA